MIIDTTRRGIIIDRLYRLAYKAAYRAARRLHSGGGSVGRAVRDGDTMDGWEA